MDIVMTSDGSMCERMSREQKERLVVYTNQNPIVFTGTLHSLDMDECARRGLRVYRLLYRAGSIVSMPGDLSLMLVSREPGDWAMETIRRAGKWLRERGVNAILDRNDLLADGRKVASCAMGRTPEGWRHVGVHFSIGPMDMELVRAICTKEMVKVPGSLGDYGVTAEDLIEALGL